MMSEENPYTAPSSDPVAPPANSGAPGPHNYATRLERFLGALIDGVIGGAVAFPLVFVFGMFFTRKVVTDAGVMSALSTGNGFGFVATVLMTLVAAAIYIAIQWTFWKRSAQSIGKLVMKTQIVNLDGTPANVENIAFKRYLSMALLGLIPVVGPFVGLANGLAIFRADYNCLHDDIAKTRVIKLPVSTEL